MNEPLKNHKKLVRDLAPAGWVYAGYDRGFYLFQARLSCGYLEMRCKEEDLTKDNLQFMADNKLTR